MMCNRIYLGDDFYPPIIDEDTFTQVREEIAILAAKLGRTELKQKEKITHIPTKFYMHEIIENYSDPIMQAEYIYSLIRSEVL